MKASLIGYIQRLLVSKEKKYSFGFLNLKKKEKVEQVQE
jgi:hypothetical protein